MTEAIIVGILTVLAESAPHVLDAIRGSASNREAIDKARAALRQVPHLGPALDGVFSAHENKITGGGQ